MAQSAKVLEFKEAAKQSILERSHALGNSKRGLKEVASDLLNREGRKFIKVMAEGMFLSRATVERVMDCPEHYRPQAETLERIFRYFGAEVHFKEVKINGRFQNKAKEW
jgi:hypothetical protein